MIIYVVSKIELDKFNGKNCNACWKVVKAFASKDNAERYVKAQKFPDDFDIMDIEFVEVF